MFVMIHLCIHKSHHMVSPFPLTACFSPSLLNFWCLCDIDGELCSRASEQSILTL